MVQLRVVRLVQSLDPSLDTPDVEPVLIKELADGLALGRRVREDDALVLALNSLVARIVVVEGDGEQVNVGTLSGS